MNTIIEGLRRQLIVSCQAYPGEPMLDPKTMAQMARAVVDGGAAAVRAQGLENIRHVVRAVRVPVIGLWKDGNDRVFITPTLEHAVAVAKAGAHIVALDGTRRPRPDGLSLTETVAALRAATDVLVMADCGSLEDALAAQEAGVDLLGTTLAGYSGERQRTTGPDLGIVDEMVEACSLPVVAEGRIRTPEQAAVAFAHGAFAVCVGTAITHPTTITRWFRATISTSGPTGSLAFEQ